MQVERSTRKLLFVFYLCQLISVCIPRPERQSLMLDQLTQISPSHYHIFINIVTVFVVAELEMDRR
jgi:hypothetical protein